ncbi:helix-turn-helix domain-containing protein [Paenibacillus dakarensis]|uniref:helix-turn-helix domain-containing protein n=1 Tax=Paenibacillus dakarensis TaxID=1527293 RepID=UPI0006D54F3C|nr:helix-turn-helix domain-containing protein [Paenibacillus dakarensis]
MKWSHFKSKLLFKYTLSYIAIFLIPLVILTVFIYQNAVITLRSEIEQSNVNQLTQAKIIIDERMKELQDQASRIAYDKQLTPYWVHHPYYSRESIEALGKYKATSSIVNELFLFFRDDEKIYSTEGLENLDVFTRRYKFHSWDKEALIRDLNTVSYPTMRPAEEVDKDTRAKQSMLAYLVPITPNNPNPHGTVMYLIDESNLTGLIDSILTGYNGITYIFDNNGQVLAANQRGETISETEARALFTLNPGTHSLELNGKSYSVVSVKSEAGWTYATAMQSNQFFSRIVHVQTVFVLVFSLVAIIGFVLAILLARKQYHPISDLMEFVRVKSDGDATRPNNELDWIKQTLHDYSQRIDLQEPYARNQLLLLLLKHGHHSEWTSEFYATLGVSFHRSHYFVICMSWETPSSATEPDPDKLPVTQLMSEVQWPELAAYAYGVELTQPGRLALIVGFDASFEDDDRVLGRMEAIVESVRAMIYEHEGQFPTIGVGTGYRSAEQLNQSYIEASTSFDASLLHRQGTITFFNKLSETQDSSFWVSKDVLLKLEQSLKQGSYDVASRMIADAMENLKLERLSVPLLRCICFDILNTMLKTASDLGIRHIVNEIPKITSFDSLEDLEKKLRELAAEICREVETQSETEESSLIDQITAYIDEHYTDYTLSLNTISSRFSISASYFSRSFKEKTGINFSQYIWQKRMDEVIRQLLHTNDPLKEIITRVGYLDTPNFIRKFKKETGCTPGQYRKIHGVSAEVAAAEDDMMEV